MFIQNHRWVVGQAQYKVKRAQRWPDAPCFLKRDKLKEWNKLGFQCLLWFCVYEGIHKGCSKASNNWGAYIYLDPISAENIDGAQVLVVQNIVGTSTPVPPSSYAPEYSVETVSVACKVMKCWGMI